jgi:hypothetical protein
MDNRPDLVYNGEVSRLSDETLEIRVPVVKRHFADERFTELLVQISEVVIGVAKADIAPIQNARHGVVDK